MDTTVRNILAASISNKLVSLDKKLATAQKRLVECDGEATTHLTTFTEVTADDSGFSPEVQSLVAEGYASFGRIVKVKRTKLVQRVAALVAERGANKAAADKLASGEEITAADLPADSDEELGIPGG